ncbi:MAG: hypothetical protein KA170_00625 [Candidatus Promineofilum sp.]|nr:hypothetical protein [Promineifilum sp.]
MATIGPDPAALELTPGQVQTVEIVLENAQQVYGIDVRVSFDPARVEIIDADPAKQGTQLVPGAFPSPDFVALNTADNTAGTLRYVVTQVNPTPPATGSGIVFSFQLRARSAGQSDLALTLVEMSDRDGMLLAVTPASATIAVVGSGPAAPTGIVLPTAEPPGSALPTASDLPTTPVNITPPVTGGTTAAPVAQVTNAALPTATLQPSIAVQESAAADMPVAGQTPPPMASATDTAVPPAESAGPTGDEPTSIAVAAEIAAGPAAAAALPTESSQRAVIGENAGGPVTTADPAATSVAPPDRAIMPVIAILIIALVILAAAVTWRARGR